MITPPARGRILVATRPVDFRRGLDGLAALVQEVLRQDPFAGDVFIFRSKRADRLKIVLFDGTGMVLVAKRLERAAFRWPPVCDGMICLSAAQFAALWDGLEWSRLPVPPAVPRPRATQ
jgi:transposase